MGEGVVVRGELSLKQHKRKLIQHSKRDTLSDELLSKGKGLGISTESTITLGFFTQTNRPCKFFKK